MLTPPKLAFGCPVSWNAMPGDDRARFCAACRRSIPNLSLLSAAERVELLRKAQSEQVCATYLVRLSGEMVTPESPLLPTERSRIRQFGAAALSAAALALAAGCVSSSALDSPPEIPLEVPETGKLTPPGDDEETIVLLTGFIVYESGPVDLHGPPAKR